MAWGTSSLLHGLALIAALSLMDGVRLSQPAQPFRWEVSLISQSSESGLASSLPKVTDRRASTMPARSSARPTIKSISTGSLPPTESAAEVQHAEPLIHRAVQKTIEARRQSLQPTNRPLVQEFVRHGTEGENRPSEDILPVAAETRIVRREVVTTQGHVSGGTTTPLAPSNTPISTGAIVRSGKGSAHAKPVLSTQGQVAVREVMSRMPAESLRTTSVQGPDYGWLADTLWRRVQTLKRYPAKAASNRLEGDVVLVALVRANGEIADVQIAHSSGHPLLDEAAMQAVRNASPLILTKPLSHDRVSIEVPISYRFE